MLWWIWGGVQAWCLARRPRQRRWRRRWGKFCKSQSQCSFLSSSHHLSHIRISPLPRLYITSYAQIVYSIAVKPKKKINTMPMQPIENNSYYSMKRQSGVVKQQHVHEPNVKVSDQHPQWIIFHHHFLLKVYPNQLKLPTFYYLLYLITLYLIL